MSLAVASAQMLVGCGPSLEEQLQGEWRDSASAVMILGEDGRASFSQGGVYVGDDTPLGAKGMWEASGEPEKAVVNIVVETSDGTTAVLPFLVTRVGDDKMLVRTSFEVDGEPPSEFAAEGDPNQSMLQRVSPQSN